LSIVSPNAAVAVRAFCPSDVAFASCSDLLRWPYPAPISRARRKPPLPGCCYLVGLAASGFSFRVLGFGLAGARFRRFWLTGSCFGGWFCPNIASPCSLQPCAEIGLFVRWYLGLCGITGPNTAVKGTGRPLAVLMFCFYPGSVASFRFR